MRALRAILIVLAYIAAFCVSVAITYAFAASIERANGGCANFFGWCDGPVTIGISLGAGVVMVALIAFLHLRNR